MPRVIKVEAPPEPYKPPLVEHGLPTEIADQRIHLSQHTMQLYRFSVEEALKAVEANKDELFVHEMVRDIDPDRYPNGVRVAEAWVMPIDWVSGIEEYPLPPTLAASYPVMRTDSTSEKGDKAVDIAMEMLEKELLPLGEGAGTPYKVTSPALQKRGVDIIVPYLDKDKDMIEVKYDHYCGRPPKGKGHLYLQYAEVNMLGEH